MTPPINNNINSLSSQFRARFDLRWSEVIAKYPNAVVFECMRSQERQDWLYSQGRTRPWKIVTWTKTSNHREGNAVDIVFRNNGKLERAGPYNDLIVMAKKYWIRNLAPKELCHFELNPTEESIIQPVVNETEERFKHISASDVVALKHLIDIGIWDWNIWQLDKRMFIILARWLYKLQ